jgi:hypothetical protein
MLYLKFNEAYEEGSITTDLGSMKSLVFFLLSLGPLNGMN